MNRGSSLMSVEALYTDVISARGLYHTVQGVSFEIGQGEILGIVGESGCGKSMTAKSILRLNQEDKTFYQGKVLYHTEDGVLDLLKLSKKEMSQLRGQKIAMVSQNPMEAFDPLYTVGDQIEEMLCYHKKMEKKEALEETEKLLEQVGIFPGKTRRKQYPHEFSGGMLQRAAIGMMISCGPRLLIADEPTTALDVTMQSQILSLLKKLRDDTGMSILLITHNFGVVAEVCDRVCVMYAGKIVESGNVEEIFACPKHPYTKALIQSIPRAGSEGRRLQTIPGTPPALNKPMGGCGFAMRCSCAQEQCKNGSIPVKTDSESHWYRCVKEW